MYEQMKFPETWKEYEGYYGFEDEEEVYTNGSRLIPSFRVKQWLDHLEQKPCGDAISKQAVLDATVKRNSIWNKITNSKGENLEEIILQLPSVKPQNDVLNKIRAEIAENGNSDINAQTVLAIIDKYRGESEGKNE